MEGLGEFVFFVVVRSIYHCVTNQRECGRRACSRHVCGSHKGCWNENLEGEINWRKTYSWEDNGTNEI